MRAQAASVSVEGRSPVGTPFVPGSRRIPHYRLPLHTSPRRTSNLSLSRTRRIPFCYATPEHTLRSFLSSYSPTTTPELCHSRAPALIVAIPVMFTVGQKLMLKFGLVGEGRAYVLARHGAWVKAHITQTAPRIRHARTRIRGVPEVDFDHVTRT